MNVSVSNKFKPWFKEFKESFVNKIPQLKLTGIDYFYPATGYF